MVDDEPESLALLASILTEGGRQVRPADSGKLALASVAASLPDLILIDMRMLGIDGLEVLRRLKSQELYIPLMFISATSGTQEGVEGLTLGPVDFIFKPLFQASFWPAPGLIWNWAAFGFSWKPRWRAGRGTHAIRGLQKEMAERRQRTEGALRESEERFRNMANNAPVMIAMAGPDQNRHLRHQGLAGLQG